LRCLSIEEYRAQKAAADGSAAPAGT